MSIDVERGESLVIVGGSGAGKSVTLKHIIGLMQPDRGQIVIDGQDIGAMKPVELNRFRRKFGMSFQEGALSTRCRSSRTSPSRCGGIRRCTEQQIRERVDECLELVHLPRRRVEAAVGALRRHAAPRRIRAGDLAEAGDPALRRADHRPRSGHQRRHRRTDRGDGPAR